jgi:hypothetical protein
LFLRIDDKGISGHDAIVFGVHHGDEAEKTGVR